MQQERSAVQVEELQRIVQVEELGRENIGKYVRLARLSRSPRNLVVVKQVQLESCREERVVRLLEMKRNGEIGVARFVGSWTEQSERKKFLVFEFSGAGNLAAHVRFSRVWADFDLPRIRFYAAEMVLALEFVHGAGVLHRDFKLENMVMHDDGHLKLVDFGTAVVLEEDRDKFGAFGNVGTPHIVAPETILSDEAGYGFPSDIFSLGVCIYQMAFGKPPFFDNCPKKTYKKILFDPLVFPKGFEQNTQLCNLLNRLLQKNPEDRPSLEQIKQHCFFQGIEWENLHHVDPPKFDRDLGPILPDDDSPHEELIDPQLDKELFGDF